LEISLCRGPWLRALPTESIGLFNFRFQISDCGFKILGYSFSIRLFP
jgi:hypothetical protein